MTITDSARRLALVAVVAMLAALLPFSGASAQNGENGDVPADDEEFGVELEGEDADEIAQAWSELAYPDAAVEGDAGPSEVLLGRDDLFADNLASGSLQGGDEDGNVNGRPLLLTDGDSLSDVVTAELERLGGADGITTVHILGGEVAISADVEAELDELGYTTNRFEGVTRTETAIDIAAGAFADADTALLVRSESSSDDDTQAFADSLGAGAWAAEAGVPILFTQPDNLTSSTAEYLESSDIETVIIIGGDSAVSDEVEAAVAETGAETDRVEGDTRFTTAIAINEARDITGDAAVLVDGQVEDAWVNGFSAANVSGNNNYPLVLSNNGELPEASETYLEDFYAAQEAAEFAAHLTNVVLICGTNVDDACDDAAAIADVTVYSYPFPTPDTNQTFVVTPQDEVTVTDDDSTAGATSDQRQYTVTNPVEGAEHTIVLFDADNVSMDEDGTVTFDAQGTTGTAATRADAGTVDSRIVVVNGSAVAAPGAQSVDVTPTGGTITFTVEGNGFESVVPVVYFDADGDNNLDIDADGAPVEAEVFGVGGVMNVLPGEAATGADLDTALILSVDKENNFVVVDLDGDTAATPNDRVTVNYGDDGDQYFVDGTAAANRVTLEQFEAVLTAGDSFEAGTVYSRNFPSTFVLSNDAPGELDILSVDASSNSIEVTIEEDDIVDGAEVELYVIEDDADTDPAFSTTTWTLAATLNEDDDESDSDDDFQITATGLESSTEYDVAVRQVVDGEASTITSVLGGLADGTSVERDVMTDAAPDDVQITNVTVNDVNNGVGTATAVIVTFDTAVTACTVNGDGFEVYPTSQPGFVTGASACAASGNSTTYTLDTPLDDASTDIQYTVELEAGSVTVTGGGLNGDLTATFNY